MCFRNEGVAIQGEHIEFFQTKKKKNRKTKINKNERTKRNEHID